MKGRQREKWPQNKTKTLSQSRVFGKCVATLEDEDSSENRPGREKNGEKRKNSRKCGEVREREKEKRDSLEIVRKGGRH